MDLKSLRYFVEIARQKSFTAAAEKLFVTQPTLSRQIADLEDELGQVLFELSAVVADHRQASKSDCGNFKISQHAALGQMTQ